MKQQGTRKQPKKVFVWWPKMGFDCHPRNVDSWMATKTRFWSPSKKLWSLDDNWKWVSIPIWVNLIIGWRLKIFNHQWLYLEKGVHVICFWEALIKLYKRCSIFSLPVKKQCTRKRLKKGFDRLTYGKSPFETWWSLNVEEKWVLITIFKNLDYWIVIKKNWSPTTKFGMGRHVVCFWIFFVKLHMWQLKATKNFIANEKKKVLASDKKGF